MQVFRWLCRLQLRDPDRHSVRLVVFLSTATEQHSVPLSVVCSLGPGAGGGTVMAGRSLTAWSRRSSARAIGLWKLTRGRRNSKPVASVPVSLQQPACHCASD